MLYIVATPIGNLADITIRAVETLKSVEIIYCEDTRRAAILCAHYDITAPLRSCHAHNERKMVSQVMSMLASGVDCAYISDAGTPTISDPGVELTRAAYVHGFRVVPIPGVSAVHTLISASGERAHPYIFYGFLPRTTHARAKVIRTLLAHDYPFLLFESPYRIVKLCQLLAEYAARRITVIGRELTKKFEEIRKGLPEEHYAYFSQKKVLGEFSVLVTTKEIK